MRWFYLFIGYCMGSTLAWDLEEYSFAACLLASLILATAITFVAYALTKLAIMVFGDG